MISASELDVKHRNRKIKTTNREKEGEKNLINFLAINIPNKILLYTEMKRIFDFLRTKNEQKPNKIT